jgi:hypothetical protein
LDGFFNKLVSFLLDLVGYLSSVTVLSVSEESV